MEAPPARASAAIALSVTNRRKNWYFIVFLDYQPLMLCSGVTLVLLAVFVLVLRNTKTDQTICRSVALLAQLHPKCPFQVEPRRVRALWDLIW